MSLVFTQGMDASELERRVRGALIGTMLGDSLGSVFEGASPGPLLERQLAARMKAPRLWRYTDDTEMTIGVAESLVACGGFDAAHMMESLATQHEPARGYGKGARRAFHAFLSGLSLEECAWSTWIGGSAGNGAAARVAPVACWYREDLAMARLHAAGSARLTHVHPDGIRGAVVMASAVAWLLRRDECRVSEFLSFVCEGNEGNEFGARLKNIGGLVATTPIDAAKVLGSDALAVDSVPLALWAFATGYPSAEEILRRAILPGGDADSIGAMAGALAGAALGADAFPSRWLEAAEDGPRGIHHLEALATEIAGVTARGNP